jgi:hypothetical protein
MFVLLFGCCTGKDEMGFTKTIFSQWPTYYCQYTHRIRMRVQYGFCASLSRLAHINSYMLVPTLHRYVFDYNHITPFLMLLLQDTTLTHITIYFEIFGVTSVYLMRFTFLFLLLLLFISNTSGYGALYPLVLYSLQRNKHFSGRQENSEPR